MTKKMMPKNMMGSHKMSNGMTMSDADMADMLVSYGKAKPKKRKKKAK